MTSERSIWFIAEYLAPFRTRHAYARTAGG